MSPARLTHTGFLDKSVLVDPRSSAGPLFVWTSSYSQFRLRPPVCSATAAGLLRNGRRNTTPRRALVHPVNCNTSSLPCHPCPASTQSSLLKICPMSFFTFPLCLSLNTYPPVLF